MLAISALLCGTPMRYELNAYEPMADPKAVVIAGKARFTVLSPQLIRMEYSDAGNFEDRPTLAFVNRRQPVPTFHWDNNRGTLTTSALTLTYKGLPFSPRTLSVASNSKKVGTNLSSWTWTYGQRSETDPGNLRGTMRTLDTLKNITLNCPAAKKARPDKVFHCEFGVVSKSGWALVDETGVPALDADDWWADSSGKMLKNTDDIDLYLFGHGHDYVGALRDLTAVGGQVPLLPRRNLGVWWTRWYDLDASDVAELPHEFARRSMPLDVLVLDMNWHSKQDWTGYTWDPDLFPRPAETLERLHDAGLSVAANLHDYDGIGCWEDTRDAVAKAMGLPTISPCTKAIQFDLTNKSYVYALEDITLASREDEGMDFWWIDWQQGEDKGNTGQDGPRLKMNPTIWLNKMRVTDAKRRCVLGIGQCSKKRGVVFGRFGGLGNHRYQHGFSGDVAGLNWQNMAYQAYFSATASNVGFGLWSHDIVGPGSDHELYARWIQLASYQSILRMHDRGESAGECRGWPTSQDGCSTDRPWNVPTAFANANEAALRSRAALVPYAYTASREAHDSGVGITRPMYYSWPEEASAYPEDMDAMLGQTEGTRQFMFGSSILVAPVTAPGDCPPPRGSAALDAPCGLTPMPIWLPPGGWFDLVTGSIRAGPASLTAHVHLSDVPAFAVGGSVIGRRPLDAAGSIVGLAATAYSALEWTVYPGGAASTGGGVLYEDDGETMAYLPSEGNHSTWIRTAFAWDAANSTIELSVAADAGAGFVTHPAARDHSFRLPCTLPPLNVTLGGKALPYAQPWQAAAGTASWTYDGAALATVVHLPSTSTAQSATVTVQTARHAAASLSGLAGAIASARRAKATLDEARIAPGAHAPDPHGTPLNELAMLGDRLSYLAGSAATPAGQAAFVSAAADVATLHAAAVTQLKAHLSTAKRAEDKARLTYALQMLGAAALR